MPRRVRSGGAGSARSRSFAPLYERTAPFLTPGGDQCIIFPVRTLVATVPFRGFAWRRPAASTIIGTGGMARSKDHARRRFRPPLRRARPAPLRLPRVPHGRPAAGRGSARGHLRAGAHEKRLFDRRKASEKTWIYAIALNCLRDHGRRRAAEGRALERVGAPGAVDDPVALGRIEVNDELQRALDDAQRRGARGDRASLRRRSERPGDRKAHQRAPHDGRGTRLPRASQAPRGAELRNNARILAQASTVAAD